MRLRHAMEREVQIPGKLHTVFHLCLDPMRDLALLVDPSVCYDALACGREADCTGG